MAIDTQTAPRSQHYKNYIGGEWVDAASGETFDVVNPATEEVFATVPSGGREDAQRAIAAARDGVRLRRVDGHGGGGAQAHPAVGARALRRGRGRARDARDDAGRHDDPRHQHGRDRATACSHWDYFSRQATRPMQEALEPVSYPTHSLQLRAARAGRRLRRDHPVELPARDGGLEAGAGARDGQHVRAEAGVEHAADRAEAGRDPRRDRPAEGRRERDHRRRLDGRRGARLAPRRRQGRVHRARPWSGGGSCSWPPARSRRRRSSWAASRRTSCSRTPTWTRRSTARCGRPSSTRARSASPARGCCCPSRSTTSSSSAWSSARSRSRSATRSTTSPTSGPLVSAAAARDRRELRADRQGGGREAGARRQAAARATQFERGYWFEPTIFTEVDNSMTIAQEEIFGPVLSVIKFNDDDDAIRIANDSIYGLASGVWSQDPDRCLETAKRLRAGTVWINDYHLINCVAPFGGYKQSGIGRELARLRAERVHRGQARALGPGHAEGAEDVRRAPVGVASRRQASGASAQLRLRLLADSGASCGSSRGSACKLALAAARSRRPAGAGRATTARPPARGRRGPGSSSATRTRGSCSCAVRHAVPGAAGSQSGSSPRRTRCAARSGRIGSRSGEREAVGADDASAPRSRGGAPSSSMRSSQSGAPPSGAGGGVSRLRRVVRAHLLDVRVVERRLLARSRRRSRRRPAPGARRRRCACSTSSNCPRRNEGGCMLLRGRQLLAALAPVALAVGVEVRSSTSRGALHEHGAGCVDAGAGRIARTAATPAGCARRRRPSSGSRARS